MNEMEINEALTKEILVHHLTAFGNNDLNEIMKDYTEESEVLTPNGLPPERIGCYPAVFYRLLCYYTNRFRL